MRKIPRRPITTVSVESGPRPADPYGRGSATYAVKAPPFLFGSDFAHAPMFVTKGWTPTTSWARVSF
eukprot:9494821-Pyramimonas_sp.AAC.1